MKSKLPERIFKKKKTTQLQKYAVAVSDSVDGMVRVRMDGVTIPRPSTDEIVTEYKASDFHDGSIKLDSRPYAGTISVVGSDGIRLKENEFSVEGDRLTIFALSSTLPVEIRYHEMVSLSVESGSVTENYPLPSTPIPGTVTVKVDDTVVPSSMDGDILKIPGSKIADDMLFRISYDTRRTLTVIFDGRISKPLPDSVVSAAVLSYREASGDTMVQHDFSNAEWSLDDTGVIILSPSAVGKSEYVISYDTFLIDTIRWKDLPEDGSYRLKGEPNNITVQADGSLYSYWTLEGSVLMLDGPGSENVIYSVSYLTVTTLQWKTGRFANGPVKLPSAPISDLSATVAGNEVPVDSDEYMIDIPSLHSEVDAYTLTYRLRVEDGEIDIPTAPSVREGETVLVSSVNHSPMAVTVIGEGDRVAGEIDAVENDIIAAKARIESLEADFAAIDILVAGYATIQQLDAASARIDSLEAETADIENIRANAAKVQNLTASQLEADHATVGSLDANYAQIGLANVNNAWITNGVVKNGAISNAMINSITANKITSGTIDAASVNVINLNADNITVGTINGQRIGTGSLGLDKLSEAVYTEDEVDAIASDLQTQIDDAIETWTGASVPTLSNAPASSWTDSQTRDKHIGDVYFVVNANSNQNGYNYRFTKSGSTYSWKLIKDSDITRALQRITAAEGDISEIEQFDSEISSWRTSTDGEISSMQAAHTALAGRVTTAEGTITQKVDISAFNQLSQTVDGNTASITTLSETVDGKADGSTVQTLSNTVNQVRQTATSNNSRISQLVTTLGTNPDGSSAPDDVVHRVSEVEQDLDGFRTTVETTYATMEAAQAAVDDSRSWYAECSTDAATANKIATILPATSSFSLSRGKTVFVRFTITNTASVASLTLNVNGTGAKPVKTLYNQSLSNLYHASHLQAGITYQFTYDGSVWIVQQNVNVDTYDRIRHTNPVKTASVTVQGSTYAVLSSSLIAWQIDGYRTVKNGDTIDISRPILWCMSNVNPGTNTTEAYDAYPSQSLRVNAGGSWAGTKDTIAYLYGTLSANDLSVEGFTSTIPTVEDGKIYIPLGLLYSTYQIAFRSTYETWAYLEDAFQQVKWTALRKSTSLEQTAESFRVQFQTQGGLINSVQSSLETKVDNEDLSDLDDRTVKIDDTRLSWMSVQDEGGAPSLILGTSASDFHSKLTNSKMSFYDGAVELAYLSGTDGLSAPRATVTNEFYIGGWALIPQSDGNLSIKYIGG